MDKFWNAIDTANYQLDEPQEIRKALLDFIADFANWDNSTNEQYLSTARALTESAHIALGGSLGRGRWLLILLPVAGRFHSKP